MGNGEGIVYENRGSMRRYMTYESMSEGNKERKHFRYVRSWYKLYKLIFMWTYTSLLSDEC